MAKWVKKLKLGVMTALIANIIVWLIGKEIESNITPEEIALVGESILYSTIHEFKSLLHMLATLAGFVVACKDPFEILSDWSSIDLDNIIYSEGYNGGCDCDIDCDCDGDCDCDCD